MFGEKYSTEKKYNYLVLFDDSTVISARVTTIITDQYVHMIFIDEFVLISALDDLVATGFHRGH